MGNNNAPRNTQTGRGKGSDGDPGREQQGKPGLGPGGTRLGKPASKEASTTREASIGPWLTAVGEVRLVECSW